MDEKLTHPLGRQSAFSAAKAKNQTQGDREDDRLWTKNAPNREDLRVHTLFQEDEKGTRACNKDTSSDKERPEMSESHSYISLSSWIPRDSNVLSQSLKSVCIQVDRGQKVVFIGKYDLWVKSGVVRVYGARLNQSNILHRIYAPSTHPLPCIECISQASSVIEIWSISSTLSKLSKYAPLYRHIWNARTSSDAPLQNSLGSFGRSSFSYLRSSADDTYYRVLYPQNFPLDWQQALSRMASIPVPTHSNSEDALANLHVLHQYKQQRIAVCGRMGLDRMVFAQLLSNYLLTRSSTMQNVYYLDLDPAMPMFSVPGIVYLACIKRPVLGPSFTAVCSVARNESQTDILKSYAFPMLTIDEDPGLACNYAGALLQLYQDHLSRSPGPLVIKCPGWTRTGVGAEIISELLIEVAAANILCLATAADHDIIEKIASNVQANTRVHTVQPCPTTTARSAEDLRKMQYISYFTQDGDKSEAESRWEPRMLSDADSLTKLSFDGLDSMLLGILVVGDLASGEFVPTVLEDSLVSVIEIYAQETYRTLQSQLYRTPDSVPILPETSLDILWQASASRLLGLGIVIHVDVRGKYMTVRTPFHLRDSSTTAEENASTDRQRHLVLVRGQFDSPTWIDAHPSQRAASSPRTVSRRHSKSLPADLKINTDGLPADYGGHTDEESEFEDLDGGTDRA